MNEATPPANPTVRRLYLAIAVLALLALALIAWAALLGGEEESGGDPAPARIVSSAELAEIAASDAPIYWAGERPGAELEYERVGRRSYVRYLTAGAKAGDPRPAFLTIATYPLPDPLAALRANAARTSTSLQRAAGGALLWVNPDRPQSVYLAEPGDSEYQVEVYDPLPRRALRVALSGEVVPIGSNAG